jgi:tripartite-type tricarboxylate transporter receptor subunit TctC
MRLGRRVAVLAAVFALVFAPAGGKALAQPYPSKFVRIIVPFPPGGPSDIIARILGQKLSEKWGRPVVVENRPGAGGNLGSELVAKAAPDGYTLLFAANSHAINATLYTNLPYDAVKDFTPVSQVASYALVLVVPTSSPLRSLKELVTLAKSKPGQLNFASASPGTPTHLAMELFKGVAGIDVVHIPYAGAAAATTELVGAQVQMMFNNPVSALPQIKAGKLRPLAVTGRKRSGLLPDVPTVEEQGYPGFEAGTWYGVLGPAGLPKPIVAKIEGDIIDALRAPDVRERLVAQLVEPLGTTAEQFAAVMKAEVAKWEKVIKAANLRVE